MAVFWDRGTGLSRNQEIGIEKLIWGLPRNRKWNYHSLCNFEEEKGMEKAGKRGRKRQNQSTKDMNIQRDESKERKLHLTLTLTNRNYFWNDNWSLTQINLRYCDKSQQYQ